MNLSVSHTSGEPIYQQIKHQIRDHILTGSLRDGELLPSIRSLAQHLQISVITTKRAYDELEQEGLVASVSGKGTFVSGGNKEAIREVRHRQLEDRIKVVVQEARALNLQADELVGLVRLFYGEGQEG
ncbi:GntR family transcriptional regulator [Paenibacillus koleovorans]|uniref:GntR family transcriptional regulator n=1 Tax=Paenibacillus koleovorans TaxID=121608 RepID=UPI000FDB24D0|nr:GntR family transcriptional regulator [Paenibacillus koleovorans]